MITGIIAEFYVDHEQQQQQQLLLQQQQAAAHALLKCALGDDIRIVEVPTSIDFRTLHQGLSAKFGVANDDFSEELLLLVM
jgi:hypothetical protein